MTGIAARYEAVRRYLTPIRNRERDPVLRERLSRLIELCIGIIQYVEFDEWGLVEFQRQLSDFEDYVLKRGKYSNSRETSERGVHLCGQLSMGGEA